MRCSLLQCVVTCSSVLHCIAVCCGFPRRFPVFVRKCVYVCAHACAHIHISTHTSIHTQTHTHTHARKRTHSCLCSHARAHTHTYIQPHPHSHSHPNLILTLTPAPLPTRRGPPYCPDQQAPQKSSRPNPAWAGSLGAHIWSYSVHQHFEWLSWICARRARAACLASLPIHLYMCICILRHM